MSTTDTDTYTGRHPVNIGHLVMGLAFVGIVGIWALVQTDTVTGDDVRWLLPIPWVVAGAVGLAVTAITGSRRHAVRQAGWVGSSTEPGTAPGWVGEQPTTAEQPTAVEETAPITAQPEPEAAEATEQTELTESSENPETPEEKP
ncbi:MAG TPA: hypothetical protein DEQ43_26950 [Nocardioides bacterium]|uniref:hypothetical protein n=1 Tax=uncultured Nocardioides sp. TaxID=198441 RepID=UPI000EBF2499|nr:hypothetical protein [uncultured Nocardioides sp.]HCB07847.1 hypothetical protein [Nocardioides sp.]